MANSMHEFLAEMMAAVDQYKREILASDPNGYRKLLLEYLGPDPWEVGAIIRRLPFVFARCRDADFVAIYDLNTGGSRLECPSCSHTTPVVIGFDARTASLSDILATFSAAMVNKLLVPSAVPKPGDSTDPDGTTWRTRRGYL